MILRGRKLKNQTKSSVKTREGRNRSLGNQYKAVTNTVDQVQSADVGTLTRGRREELGGTHKSEIQLETSGTPGH